MGQWLVNQNDDQFSVDGLEALQRMANDSELWPGDMIQPDGATDWVYAVEITELQDLLKTPKDDEEVSFRKSGGAGTRWALFGVFLVISVVGFGMMGMFAMQLPSGETRLLGDGGTLQYTEMLMTTSAPLRAEPEPASAAVAMLAKDERLDLLAKRGNFYKARNQAGQEGWVTIEEVLAVYKLGGAEIRAKMDPLYNPDQYVTVENASWMMLEAEGNNVTNFTFMLLNDSKFEMTDLVLEAVIKDSKGSVVGREEFNIGGTLKPKSSTMVGMLQPAEADVKAALRSGEEPPVAQLLTSSSFEEMAKENEEMYLRWVDMINVELQDHFDEATVRVVELRAIPNP